MLADIAGALFWLTIDLAYVLLVVGNATSLRWSLPQLVLV